MKDINAKKTQYYFRNFLIVALLIATIFERELLLGMPSHTAILARLRISFKLINSQFKPDIPIKHLPLQLFVFVAKRIRCSRSMGLQRFPNVHLLRFASRFE